MQDQSEVASVSPPPDRLTLVRDIVVLQVKLIVDGARDFALVPISIVVGLIRLLRPEQAGTEFYKLLRLGRSTERWIDLFGAAERVQNPKDAEPLGAIGSLDEIVSRIESYVSEEYDSGRLTSQAKQRLDDAVEKLHQGMRKRRL